MSKRTKTLAGMAATAIIIFAAVLIATSTGSDDKKSAKTDGVFITGMVPHHRSAVEMAQIALQRGQHPEITQLANNIISSQSQEINQMGKMHQRLFGTGVDASGMNHGGMGMSEHEMGMDMNPAKLKTAKPFDRAFVDMMIPHHQGAIRMARVELAKGDDAEAKRLAQAIIAAQTKEINGMNAWRKTWYGSTSPAGGVPKGGSSGAGQMDHSM